MEGEVLVGPVGIEPTTHGLKERQSITVLAINLSIRSYIPDVYCVCRFLFLRLFTSTCGGLAGNLFLVIRKNVLKEFPVTRQFARSVGVGGGRVQVPNAVFLRNYSAAEALVTLKAQSARRLLL